jgi:hypothetical protein
VVIDTLLTETLLAAKVPAGGDGGRDIPAQRTPVRLFARSGSLGAVRDLASISRGSTVLRG